MWLPQLSWIWKRNHCREIAATPLLIDTYAAWCGVRKAKPRLPVRADLWFASFVAKLTFQRNAATSWAWQSYLVSPYFLPTASGKHYTEILSPLFQFQRGWNLEYTPSADAVPIPPKEGAVCLPGAAMRIESEEVTEGTVISLEQREYSMQQAILWRVVLCNKRSSPWVIIMAAATNCMNDTWNTVITMQALIFPALAGTGEPCMHPFSRCLIGGLKESHWMIFPILFLCWKIKHFSKIIPISGGKEGEQSAST